MGAAPIWGMREKESSDFGRERHGECGDLAHGIPRLLHWGHAIHLDPVTGGLVSAWSGMSASPDRAIDR